MGRFFTKSERAIINSYREKYNFVGDCYYGRRVVGIRTDRMRYAIAVAGEVISPWFDRITIMASFNICTEDGKKFLTSANGKEIISDDYEEIGRFKKVAALDKYYAKVKGFDGSLGTLCSNGMIGIECSQEVLISFGAVYAICGKKIDGQMRYAVFAVNGEKVTDYEYISYEKSEGKVCLKTEDGKCVSCDTLGVLTRK